MAHWFATRDYTALYKKLERGEEHVTVETLDAAIGTKTLWLDHFNRLEVAFLLCALVVQATLLLVAFSHVRGADRQETRRQWSQGVALLSTGCVATFILLAALLTHKPSWLLPGLITAGLVYLLGILAWTYFGVGVERYLVQIWRQRDELRHALDQHRSQLDDIVGRRTVAMNREIQERRRQQEELHRALDVKAAELELASNLQQSLLSAPPHLPYLKIEVHSHAASAVSGDTYSFTHDDESVRILLADAMGHGIAAALITQLVMAASLSMPANSSASSLYGRLNRMIANGRHDAYVTASWLRIFRDGRLEFSGAGNAPLLIWRQQDKTLVELDGAGQALGMFEQIFAPHTVQAFQLNKGDRVILSSDGLLEWRGDDGKMFGVEGVRQSLQNCAADALDFALAGLQTAAWEHAGMRSSSDDVTVIGLEYIGKDGAQA